MSASLSKEKLGLDTTNLAGSDSVGAYLVDSAGNFITSQTNGSQRALDVGVNVGGVQIDPRQIRALTSADVVTSNQGTANTIGNAWPVKLTDGTNTASITAAGELKVDITSPIELNVTSDVADDAADSENPIKVGTRASFGSPLSAISTTNDRADMVSDHHRRLRTNPSGAVSALNSAVTVGVTANKVLTAENVGRITLLIQNLGSKPIYLGSSSGVTTLNGLQVPANSTFSVDLGPEVSLWAISGTAGQDVRVLEIG